MSKTCKSCVHPHWMQRTMASRASAKFASYALINFPVFSFFAVISHKNPTTSVSRKWKTMCLNYANREWQQQYHWRKLCKAIHYDKLFCKCCCSLVPVCVSALCNDVYFRCSFGASYLNSNPDRSRPNQVCKFKILPLFICSSSHLETLFAIVSNLHSLFFLFIEFRWQWSCFPFSVDFSFVSTNISMYFATEIHFIRWIVLKCA